MASPTKRQVSLIQGLQGSDWSDAQVTLLSLEPVSGIENSGFRDWKVLGSAQLSVAEGQQCLTALLGEVTADAEAGLPCFEPRHGLRLKGQGKNLDLVICFECNRFRAYGAGITESGCLESRVAEEVFDTVAREHRLALSRKR